MTPKPSVMPKLVQCSPRSSSQQLAAASAKRKRRAASSESGSPSPAPGVGRHATKNKARRERVKQLKTAVAAKQAPAPKPSPNRASDTEWKAITVVSPAPGARICKFHNLSCGCRFGKQCRERRVCAGSVAVPITRGQPITSRSDLTSALHLVSPRRRLMSQLATEWW
eukprot:4899598-Amphidinium_carterae.1